MTPPSRFRIKELNNDISLQMANIFNLSVVTGVFLSALKLAKAIPIFKKESKLTCSSYRPIYLISNLGKFIEKLMYNKFMIFLGNTG